MATPKVFISYRRDDVPGDARGVRDALAKKLGRKNVFMDIDDLRPGERFDTKLLHTLDQCKVFIAIIGPRWTELLDQKQKSRDVDYVVLEISEALRRGIRVIPVRVGHGGAAPPIPSLPNLPKEISALFSHHIFDIRHERFGRDVRELVESCSPSIRSLTANLQWAAFIFVLGVVWLTYRETDKIAPSPASTPQIDPALTVMPGTGQSFRDTQADKSFCAACPDMVVLPVGKFTMGTSKSEQKRLASANSFIASYVEHEGPQRIVEISRAFAVAQKHVTKKQFSMFVDESHYDIVDGCIRWDGNSWSFDQKLNWKFPGFEQKDNHPVVCISWNDAKQYIDWLKRKTGKRYRLLSEAEYEYAIRAVRRPDEIETYFFPDELLCGYANGADASSNLHWRYECRDSYPFTAPVGSFATNDFGLFDIVGNAWSYVEDCWNDTYDKAPTNGSAWLTGDCRLRVVRGGAWDGGRESLRSAHRSNNDLNDRKAIRGLRIARDL